MNKLLTYTQAKKQIELLQSYVKLIENYDANASVDNWIIKQYALTNSISKIIKSSNQDSFPFHYSDLTRDYIKDVILDSRGNDELQQLLKSAYINRYKK